MRLRERERLAGEERRDAGDLPTAESLALKAMLALEERQVIDVVGRESLRLVVGGQAVVEREVIAVGRHVAAVRGVGGQVLRPGVSHAHLETMRVVVEADLQRVVVVGEERRAGNDAGVARIWTDVVDAGIGSETCVGVHAQGARQLWAGSRRTRQAGDAPDFRHRPFPEQCWAGAHAEC